MSKPNFLMICTDQMRADHMGCAGNPVIRTPRLDRLAAEGVYAPRAYVNCPLCQPGRATMLTGMTPRGHGVRTNGIPLDPALPTMPGTLAAAGYRTGSVGKIHVSNYGFRREGVEQNLPFEQGHEVIEFWRDGRKTSVPTPYYGHQHVEITLGHGGPLNGNYQHWLRDRFGDDIAAKLNDRSQWKRSPLGAENCATLPIPEEAHHTAYVAERSIAYMKDAAASGQPFYLWASFPDPHHPYHCVAPWDSMYSPADVVPPVGREGELDDLAPHFRDIHERAVQMAGRGAPTKMSDAHRREIIAYTYGMVSMLDKYVGQMLDALDELGLAENTVVVFISDHGDMLGDHGLLNKGPFHFEGLLRVPMIWRWPGQFKQGRATGLASLLDFAPTVLDLAGVPIPEGPTSIEAPHQPPAWPGRSLVPMLRGKVAAVQDSVVIENDEDYLGLRLRTLVTPTHKLTTYTSHRNAEPYGELFDLQHDPHELHNLWHDLAHRTTRSTLIEQLHHRLTETDIALPRRLAHA